MANIGLSKPKYAIYKNNGTTVTYSGGAVIGKAVSLDMSLDGGDLLPAPMAAILGVAESAITGVDAVTTADAKWLMFNDDQETPYVGFGAIGKKQINNQTKWVAIIYPKIQFQNLGDALTTQGETIEWQTPEITATLMRDDTAKHEWRRMSSPLDSEAEAEALLNSFLNITA